MKSKILVTVFMCFTLSSAWAGPSAGVVGTPQPATSSDISGFNGLFNNRAAAGAKVGAAGRLDELSNRREAAAGTGAAVLPGKDPSASGISEIKGAGPSGLTIRGTGGGATNGAGSMGGTNVGGTQK